MGNQSVSQPAHRHEEPAREGDEQRANFARVSLLELAAPVAVREPRARVRKLPSAGETISHPRACLCVYVDRCACVRAA